MSSKKLTFFITINKLTDEITLQEGSLISLKIPKQWQKLDSDVENPALWVCHLPTNSLGIVYVSLYPTELVIKKRSDDYLGYSDEDLKNLGVDPESTLITFKGMLEPNGENDKERFYRCELKEVKEVEPETSQSSSGVAWFIVIIIVVLIIVGVALANKRNQNTF